MTTGQGTSAAWSSANSGVMGGLREGSRRFDLDRVRGDDGDHPGGCPGGELRPGGDRPVLDRAVLEGQVDLAGAGLRPGDAEVDRAGAADRPVDPGGAVGLQSLERPHRHRDQIQRQRPGPDRDSERRQAAAVQ